MTSGTTPEWEEISIEEIWEDEPSAPRRVPPVKPKRPSVPQLVQTVIGEGQTLLKSQFDLLMIKVKRTSKVLAIGIGMVAAALIFVFYLLWWIFHTVEIALTYVLPAWAASLIVVGILLALIIALALIGVRLAKKAGQEKPNVEGLQTDFEALKDAVKEGKDR